MNEIEFSLNNPTPSLAWKGYKRFSRKEVICADDGFLFQIGCYNFTGEQLFYLDFVRQFTIENKQGEYDHMEQLHIEFTRQPTPELEELENNLWAYDFDSPSAFFSAVENMKEFQVVITYSNWHCEIYQEKV